MESNQDAPSPHQSEDRDEDDIEDEEHEENEEEEEDQDNDWDEGGPSKCGYSESVHDTLMSVGQSVHKVVGEPSENTEKEMLSIGNWFQEASYAVRDFFSGKEDTGMKEDIVTSMMSGATKDGSDLEETPQSELVPGDPSRSTVGE